MFHHDLFDRSFFHSFSRKGAMRPTFLIAFFPVILFTTLLLTPKIITYTSFGSIIIRRSELGPLTGIEDFSLKISDAGHDFGAISSEASFDVRLPVIKPFSYTFDGRTVVRRSELGPLTGTAYTVAQVRGPGRDFGAIDGEFKPGS